jgi:hypothetical protein
VRKYLLASASLIALLSGSAVGVVAQDEGGLVTEEVEPGVERIIRDDAGHDLDEKHPTYRYDMDRIAIAPDGTVWLATSYSRSDNDAHPEVSDQLVWALGRPGAYEARYEKPPRTGASYLYFARDGTKTIIEVEGVSSEDGAFVPDFEEPSLWEADFGEEGAVLVVRPDGDQHLCQMASRGVRCEDAAGTQTYYLWGTQIKQIAAAPEGTLWVVGGYDGDNGGLYRITLD